MNNDEFISSSNEIYDGDIQKDLNPLLERVIKFLFKKLEIDHESIDTFREYSEKGEIVFASFHSTNTSLLILHILLRRNGFVPPAYALEYNPFLLQRIGFVLRRVGKFLGRFFLRRRSRDVLETDYIEKLIRGGKIVLVPLLSRRFFLRRYMEIKHDSIIHLVDIQKRLDRPLYLMPQMIFWNMNPEKTRSLITSRATGDRGLISAWLTNLKCITPSFVRLLKPIDLKEEIESSPVTDSTQIAVRIRNKLLEIYHYEKRTVLGPILRSRQEMMEKVLYHKNVLDTIERVSRDDGVSEKKLRKEAYHFFKEIAANFSILTIWIFKAGAEWMFRRIFDGFSYDPDSIRILKEYAQKGPIVLTPSHKSHMDYLIVSYLFFMNKMIPPHIAAGINLSFFPLGTLFRRSGAFFLRRTFRGLQLYPVVFKQYLKTLISEGYSIEFFIEGGRTRTGKLVFPKMGFLNYLIEAIDEGYNRDLYFVPISVNYDRILEEASYQEEIQGKTKIPESTSVLVESRKLLRRKYGKVYVTFNEPFSLKDLQGRVDSSEVADAVAKNIINKIYEVTVVTPFALTTTAILLSSVKGFSKRMLAERIINLYDYLVYSHVKLSDSLLRKRNIEQIVEYVIEAYLDDNILEELRLSETETEETLEDLYILNEENRSRIAFYKNSIIHYFIPLAYCCLELLNLSREEETVEPEALERGYCSLHELFAREFIFPDENGEKKKTCERIYEFLRYEKLIDDDGLRINPEKRDVVHFYAKILREYLESYLIVLNTVMQHSVKMNRREYIRNIRKNGIRMYHLGEVQLAESLSLPNYHNALDKLVEYGILRKESLSKKDIFLARDDVQHLDELSATLKDYLACIG